MQFDQAPPFLSWLSHTEAYLASSQYPSHLNHPVYIGSPSVQSATATPSPPTLTTTLATSAALPYPGTMMAPLMTMADPVFPQVPGSHGFSPEFHADAYPMFAHVSSPTQLAMDTFPDTLWKLKPLTAVDPVKCSHTPKKPKPTGRKSKRAMTSSTVSSSASSSSKPKAGKRKSRAKRVKRDTRGHTTTEIYLCEHDGCGKSFTRPYNLTSHMRTHTLERPFLCTQCGRGFARQHDRNRHEKLHWGIKPYTCKHCQKSFARTDALSRHLKVENGCGSLERE